MGSKQLLRSHLYFSGAEGGAFAKAYLYNKFPCQYVCPLPFNYCTPLSLCHFVPPSASERCEPRTASVASEFNLICMAAAVERGVRVELLMSEWDHTRPAMLKYLASLQALDGLTPNTHIKSVILCPPFPLLVNRLGLIRLKQNKGS